MTDAQRLEWDEFVASARSAGVRGRLAIPIELVVAMDAWSKALANEADNRTAEITKLERQNTDKYNHLTAYCKAADEDRAEIKRLTRERDASSAMLRALVQLTAAAKGLRIQDRHLWAADGAIEAARSAGITFEE